MENEMLAIEKQLFKEIASEKGFSLKKVWKVIELCSITGACK